jgi:hypothetical protein
MFSRDGKIKLQLYTYCDSTVKIHSNCVITTKGVTPKKKINCHVINYNIGNKVVPGSVLHVLPVYKAKPSTTVNDTFWQNTHKYTYGSGSRMTSVRPELQNILDSNDSRVAVSFISHYVQIASQAQSSL